MANFFKVNNKSTKKIKPTNVVININKLDMNGCGVGVYKEKPIFIDDCLPNEKVEVCILEEKRKYVRGKLVKRLTESQQRGTPMCPHFYHCGGCDLQHLSYPEQLVFKKSKVKELFSRSGLTRETVDNLPWQPSITHNPYHYRRRARIGVQFNKQAQACIGFRQKGSNQLSAIKHCPALVEPLADIFSYLKAIIDQLTVKKAIGHIEVVYSDGPKETSLKTLVIRQLRKPSKYDLNLWSDFAEKHRWQIIFDHGEGNFEYLNEYQPLHYSLLENIQISFSHDDFIQVNEDVNQTMVQQALNWLQLSENDQLLDLFCGLGNFSLPAAKMTKLVVGVEGVQAMVDKAQLNASNNHLSNVQFYQADLNNHWLEQTWAKQSFDKAILDPARAGAEQAIEQLVSLNITTILYISCDPISLARDSQILLAHDYKIVKIGLIDMFSQTKHVETMVLFNK